MVEVGQDVLASAVKGPSETGDLVQARWHAGGDGADEPTHQVLGVGAVGVAVGVDHLLVNRPGDLDDRVALVGEQLRQPCPLAVGGQATAGAKSPARRVECIGRPPKPEEPD